MNRSIARLQYLLLAGLTCILISCTGMDSDTGREIVSNFKVAAILSHSVVEDAWSRSIYDGLELAKQQLAAQTAYTSEVHNLPKTQTATIFEQYAEQGFDLVIGENSEYIASLETIAQNFPRTKFAVLDAYAGNNANLGSLSFRNGELGYLAGTIAALKTKTNKIAFMGGVESRHSREIATLFEQGARAIKPDILVSSYWASNTAMAEQVARMQIQAGNDVLLVHTDQSNAAIHALAQEMGVHTIGWINDEYKDAPKAVITSGVQHVPQLLLQGAILVRQGRWQGKQYRFGLREGVQGLAPFRGALTAEEEAIVNQVRQDILTNKIDVSV